MWQKLLNAPWPDQSDLPLLFRQQAAIRIHNYWRGRMWALVLGEVILWIAGQFKDPHHARAYALPVLLIGLAYILGWFPRIALFWLISMAALFVMQGMLIKGLGGVTAVSLMLPYTFASMMFAGRKRVTIQACCVVGFWFSLLYDFSPVWGQVDPLRYFLVSYSILIATTTFQGLRFLNQLAIELNTTYVGREVTQRSQQFLARVSHELRTPLNSVLGFAKMLRRTELPQPQAGYLTQIVEEGEQLNHLVSDLLDSAQLSAGKLILVPGEGDVNAICQAVAEEITSLLKPAVTLHLTLTPDLPIIRADTLRLRQIVRNLVGNAAKYTMHGEIRITTMQRSGQIKIAVSDTGPGIPDDQKSLVFVPFLKLDGRSAGIGLGLDIALQLTRLHGGDIEIESMVGIGSTFTVSIPIQAIAIVDETKLRV
ncbi:MAG: HAMP domain-containing sensor histidine kinase [Chloroflexota bacterium]